MKCGSCNLDVAVNSAYCSHCGERINPPRLTLQSIFSRFLSEFLDLDNKFLKTFRHLFSQPENVIDSYVQGYRKKYMNVLTYFSLSLTLIAVQLFVIKTFYPELLTNVFQSGEPGTKEAEFMMKGQEYMMKLFDYQGLLTIIFTPVAAIISWIAFADKHYNVAEHVILNIYPTAQYSIVWFISSFILFASGLDYQTGAMVSFFFLIFYMIYIFKRVFEMSWLATIFRTLIYYVLYMIVYSIFFLALGIVIGVYLGATGKIS